MTNPTGLPSTAVLGKVLLAITQKFEMHKDGIDFAWSYYHLDSRFVISLPGGGYDGIFPATPSPDASPIEHRLLDQIYNQRIVDVLREPSDSNVDHEAPYLILANGFVVSDVLSAPHGTCGAGVLILRPHEIDTSQLVPIWS